MTEYSSVFNNSVTRSITSSAFIVFRQIITNRPNEKLPSHYQQCRYNPSLYTLPGDVSSLYKQYVTANYVKLAYVFMHNPRPLIIRQRHRTGRVCDRHAVKTRYA